MPAGVESLLRAVQVASTTASLEPLVAATRNAGCFDAVTVTRVTDGDFEAVVGTERPGVPPVSLDVVTQLAGHRPSRSRRSRGPSQTPGHFLAPIRVDGREWGFVVARDSRESAEQPYSQRLVDFCAALASGLGQQLVRLEQRGVIAQQAWMLEGQRQLLRVAESMLIAVDPTELLQEIVDRLGAVVDVDTIDLALHYPDDHMLRTIAAKGLCRHPRGEP
jgi:hypothetical protein